MWEKVVLKNIKKRLNLSLDLQIRREKLVTIANKTRKVIQIKKNVGKNKYNFKNVRNNR